MDEKLKELLKQVIVMILYAPGFPQLAKTELLTKALNAGFEFDINGPSSPTKGDKECDNMIEKIKNLITAIDDCEGCLIPYPTAKQMFLIRCALQAVVDEDASHPSDPEDGDHGEGYYRGEDGSVSYR